MKETTKGWLISFGVGLALMIFLTTYSIGLDNFFNANQPAIFFVTRVFGFLLALSLYSIIWFALFFDENAKSVIFSLKIPRKLLVGLAVLVIMVMTGTFLSELSSLESGLYNALISALKFPQQLLNKESLPMEIFWWLIATGIYDIFLSRKVKNPKDGIK